MYRTQIALTSEPHGHQHQGSTRGGASLPQFRFRDNLRSMSWNRFHEQLSSKHSEPLSHAGESDPRLGSSGIKAHAKVSDLQDDGVIGTGQLDDCLRRTTVLNYIVQRFLRDTVNAECQVGWHVFRQLRDIEGYWNTLLRRDLLAKLSQNGAQTEKLNPRGMEITGKAVDVPSEFADLHVQFGDELRLAVLPGLGKRTM